MNREQGKGGSLVIKRYGELWSNQKQIKELKTKKVLRIRVETRNQNFRP